jgi:putative hydrolase of the HAD superfamily
VQAVIFDFGNVLCFPPSPEKITHAAAFCQLSEAAFLEAFWTRRLDYDQGLLSPLEYWSSVVPADFAQTHLAHLIDLEVDFWNQFDARPFAWIQHLRRKGVRVGLLSNLPRVLGERLRATRYLGRPFLDHFDHATLSYERKLVKPQAAIYTHSILGVGVEPNEALFLDDKLPNIEGARATGLHAELFTSWEDFLAQGIAKRYSLPLV